MTSAWPGRLLAVAALLVVLWSVVTQWGAISHGHPAYPVLLALTALGAGLALWRGTRTRVAVGGWRRVLQVVGLVAGAAWVTLVGWLCPLSAQDPALAAMQSDARVTVAETAAQIMLTPAGGPRAAGFFFQPGAKVDARAYAAVLRPVAEAGYLVVIPKQPLGIAFLATEAFEGAVSAHPGVRNWVVGGHSLGGTVAAIDADDHDDDPVRVVGLVLLASYPAGDISGSLEASVLSLSGSADGLATPAKISESRATLPAAAEFVTFAGVNHAYFGDYGVQGGDGTPSLERDEARGRITDAILRFLAGVSG